MLTLPSYVLITPARNEAEFIGLTIESVLAQTVRPIKWVIVSDGSTDATSDIVRRYAVQHGWIELLELPERAERHFAGKAAAVNAGWARVAGLDYAVIGNLDADVSFQKDYLAFLLSKFAENPRLGVAGTPYLEQNGLHDARYKNPEHVSGACQMFRRECFEAIGGYSSVRSGGIDFIALLSARAMRWETKTFRERACIHHRHVGSGQHANVYRRLLHLGTKDYLLGSHPVFEIFRSVYRMKNRPYFIGGALMLIGYASAMLRRDERTMPEELIEHRRRDQIQRLKAVLRRPLSHRSLQG